MPRVFALFAAILTSFALTFLQEWPDEDGPDEDGMVSRSKTTSIKRPDNVPAAQAGSSRLGDITRSIPIDKRVSTPPQVCTVRRPRACSVSSARWLRPSSYCPSEPGASRATTSCTAGTSRRTATGERTAQGRSRSPPHRRRHRRSRSRRNRFRQARRGTHVDSADAEAAEPSCRTGGRTTWSPKSLRRARLGPHPARPTRFPRDGPSLRGST